MTDEQIILLAVICRNADEVAIRIKSEAMGNYFRVKIQRVEQDYLSDPIPDRFWTLFSQLPSRFGRPPVNTTRDVRRLLYTPR